MAPARVPTAFAPFSSIVVRGPAALVVSEAKTWLVALACQKAKELGYPHELWTQERSRLLVWDMTIRIGTAATELQNRCTASAGWVREALTTASTPRYWNLAQQRYSRLSAPCTAR